MKKLMVNSIKTLKKIYIRLLLSLASTHKLNVWKTDVKPAYIKSETAIGHPVYI